MVSFTDVVLQMQAEALFIDEGLSAVGARYPAEKDRRNAILRLSSYIWKSPLSESTFRIGGA